MVYMLNTPSDSVVKLREVSAFYDKSHRLSVSEFLINRGEQVALLGRSGSGKSTLLNIMAGFLLVKQGEVEVCGESLVKASESQRDLVRRAKIGMVFQTYQLLNEFSVWDNILLGLKFSNKPFDPSVEQRVWELLDQLDLSEKMAQCMPSELSVGQRQRVSIARALIKDPELILADEPTGALDQETAVKVCDTLQSLAGQQNTSLVFVTHDQGLAQRFPREERVENILHWS